MKSIEGNPNRLISQIIFRQGDLWSLFKRFIGFPHVYVDPMLKDLLFLSPVHRQLESTSNLRLRKTGFDYDGFKRQNYSKKTRTINYNWFKEWRNEYIQRWIAKSILIYDWINKRNENKINLKLSAVFMNEFFGN